MPMLAAVKKPRQLRKRDQSYASFDAQKILHAITAAGRATGEFNPHNCRAALRACTAKAT